MKPIEEYSDENGHALLHYNIPEIRERVGPLDKRINMNLEFLLEGLVEDRPKRHSAIQMDIQSIKTIHGEHIGEFYESIYGYVCLDLLYKNLEDYDGELP